MWQIVLGAILLSCSLGLGPLISSSNHATTKSADGVVATLNWRDDLRWQTADDGGGRYKAVTLGPASVRINAPGIAPQVVSVGSFLMPGHAYATVTGPSDGCGASTNLAILPKRGSPLPYVVAFVVHAEKGCLAVPVVFDPLRDAGGRYSYVGAPYFTIWSSQPKATGAIRVGSMQRVTLPAASAMYGSHKWTVIVAENALASGPRAVTFEQPAAPKQIRPGSTVMLGTDYFTWFAQH